MLIPDDTPSRGEDFHRPGRRGLRLSNRPGARSALGPFAMGGAFPGAYPPAMRVVALGQVAILAAVALVTSHVKSYSYRTPPSGAGGRAFGNGGMVRR